MMRTQYFIGVSLVVISTIVFSLAGIFTKSVQTDAWGVIFWRGLSAAGFTIGYLMVTNRLRDELSRWGWPAFIAAALGAVATAAFINAFKLTSVANVALIWATAPFVTALMAWVAVREMPTRATVIASVLSIVGISIVVQGSFSSGNLLGDVLAAVMVILMCASMVVFRVWPETPASLSAAMSSIMLLPMGWVLTDASQSAQGDMVIMIAFGLFFAVASVTLFEGVRRVPAAQAALIGTIETPLAPIWAYLILSEIPERATILGGTIIISAVIWSQLHDQRQRVMVSASG